MSITPVTIQNFFWRNSSISSFITKSSFVAAVSLVGLRVLSSTTENSNFSLTKRAIALMAGITLLTLFAKNWKKFLFEISLISTSRNSLPWWHQINDHLVLGAIPLEEHRDKLTS